MILIGSRALAIACPGVLTRASKDFDYVCTETEARAFIEARGLTDLTSEPNRLYAMSGETHVEFDLAGGSNLLLRELAAKDGIETSLGLVPCLDLLFTIKSAHRYKKDSPHFWKNLTDWHRMRAAGAKVRPEYREFLKAREAESYTYAHPKLNQGKDTFFADVYEYDHDSIHAAIALQERPAYTYFLKAEVMTSRELFMQQPRRIQINSVIEESCVLAIERSLVPHPGVLEPHQAWRYALSKVCTSIASGWWREFAYENAFDVLRQYPADYWSRFQQAVKENRVAKANAV